MPTQLGKDIFGWTGTVIATFFYIAPCVPYRKVIRGEIPCSDAPSLLLIMSYLNCILWKVYGLNDPEDPKQVYVANALGEIISIIWIFIYFVFWMNRHFGKGFLVGLAFLAFATGLDFLSFKVIPNNVLGKMAMVFNVLMYAAPGEKIVRVIKTQNFTLIPIFSTVLTCICSGCWLAFGIYKNDTNLIIPNALGLTCGVLQLIVYLWLYCKHGGKVPPQPSAKKSADDAVKEDDEKKEEKPTEKPENDEKNEDPEEGNVEKSD